MIALLLIDKPEKIGEIEIQHRDQSSGFKENRRLIVLRFAL